MGCLGVHFAIKATTAKRLLKAEGDDEALVELVQEEIVEEWDEARLFETDKAWDALHRCLSDGTLEVTAGTPPLNLCFFGGKVLNEESDYFVVLLTPAQVGKVAKALPKVTESELRKRYFDQKFPGYQGEKSEEDFDYTWTQFQGLPEFFARAAKEKRWVVFTVDQ